MDGDNSGLGPWAQRLSGDAERLPSNADIFCADEKKRNWFNVSARALSYASTSVEGNVIRIMGQDGRAAARPVP